MTETAIRLCCTSFLLPGGPFWQPLAQWGRLDFGSYGDWPAALLADDDRPLIWVLFLADVLTGQDDDQDALSTLLHPLIHRLTHGHHPVIVAWSAHRPISPIADARAPSPWRRLARRVEDALYDLAARYPALYVLDLDRALAADGLNAAFDARNFHAARCRLSRQGLTRTAAALSSIMGRLGSAAKKVLVLDCDNTLWGGVVGEVGLSGLSLGGDGMGKVYAQIQQAAQDWGRQGILLVLASKNNETDVWQVFDHHPGMVLKRSDVVAWAINWREKPANLAALADDLGLGLDSFVFMDDNPLERDKMRNALPRVTTLDLPADVTAWPDLLAGTDLFARFAVTAEDLSKTSQYRSRSDFIQARQGGGDESGFLRSIALCPAALPLDSGTLARAEQLCAKTNQFNLRLQRHSAAHLADLAARCGDAAHIATLSDKFGDHGMVGLSIAVPQGRAAWLDSFMLSCRVLGRHLEAWMLHRLCQSLRAQGCRWLVAQYNPGERNQMAADFLPDHGFLPAPLPDPIRDDPDIQAAIAALSPDGILYWADLDTLTIPHLDVFPPC